MSLALVEERLFIGNGRSAKVYLSYQGDDGVATKTFTGEPVSKFILFLLTGSANPYTWCEDAINSALIRRRLLSSFCQLWFNGKLRLPKTYGYRWNPAHKAYEIDAEFIQGQHAPIFTPLNKEAKDYMSELRHEIMIPLQGELVQAGFDGLVWQAGKGNPVGTSNFMLLRQEDGSEQWIWIDLESGLPALFALNPLSTLFYYLPKCLEHRDWLFDNVNTTKLKKYLEHNKTIITQKLGQEAFQALCDDCELLATTQHNWKNLQRHKRSLYYAASQDKISTEEKEFYEDKPVRWYLRSIEFFIKAFVLKIQDMFKEVFDLVLNFRYKKFSRRLYSYFTSSFYRWGLARWILKREVDKWHARKFLDDDEARLLKDELRKDEASAYLTDFSIHIAIKPFVKLFSWVVVPVLIAADLISLQAGAFFIIGSGSIARTAYTVWRIANNMTGSRPQFPLIALVVGILPVVGNLAYPAEILYRSTGNKGMIAKFIAYSFSTKIGSKVPIWGGNDSGVEHFFNKICHKVFSR